MAVAKIFKCSGNEAESIPEPILDNLSFSFEEINKDASKMASLSKKIKEYNNSEYCTLPFCNTVEAESFGSKVIFDHIVGNRIGDYAIKDISQIDDMEKMDLSNSRAAEILKAIRILKEAGERVVVNITGPISLATSIMDSRTFYKLIRKDTEKASKLLKTIEDSLVDFILESIKSGVDIISFADPTGCMDIVGPKVYKEVSGKYTYNILKRVEGQMGQALIHLCGKTSTSLEATDLIETHKLKVEGSNYFEMLRNIKKERKDVNFIGHWCMKQERKNNIVVSCELL